MIHVKVLGNRSCHSLYALIDEGSTVSLINNNVIEKIGAKVTQVNVSLKGVGSEETIAMCSRKTNIQIQSGASIFNIKNVLVIKDLALPMQHLNKELVKLCFEKTGIQTDAYNAIPDMLLGQDNCNLIVTREFREIVGKSLLISRCTLGWSIHGSYNKNTVKQINCLNHSLRETSTHKIDYKLDKIVKLYFDIDAIGIINHKLKNPKEERALEILESTSRFMDNYWEVGLLWEKDDSNFSNGRSTALRRLHLLERRLDRDSKYASMYYREINRLLNEGFAQEVNEISSGDKIRYLPHFGVENINKPDKLRLVFDAAAKTANVSFNDLLLSGPDLLKSLPGVIMRFRQFAYAIKSDLKDMFLKIKIRPEDRDAQRFLWRDKNRTSEPKEYVMSSMIFGAKSSPCTALYIKNKNAALFLTRYPTSANSIIENCYMDDFLDSCITKKEAISRVSEVIEINKNAGWQMHSWASNAPDILIKENATNIPKQLIKAEIESQQFEKVLGLKWLNLSDELSFNVNLQKLDEKLLSGLRKPTKREFLSVIMSIFDPLGFLSPFTIRSRILMQNIWSSKISWDEVLHDTEFEQWKKWVHDLELIKHCRISRCYQLKDSQVKCAELHIFCDASSKAFAAVAYWRFLLSNEKAHVSFIMSKARVAPLKAISIPRLELQAAVIAVRVAQIVANEHRFKITRRIFWSDSKSVLQWIRNDPRDFKVFVANRLGEVKENSKISEWRWVPTKENPADDGTRVTIDALKSNSRWFTGPSFLQKSEELWPKENFQKKHNNDESELLEKVKYTVCTCIKSSLIDISRFSSWTRLIFTIARILKAIDIWKKRIRTTTTRISEAEEICFRLSQSSSFYEELNALSRQDKIPKSSCILNLNIYLDEKGIIRSDSRIINFAENENLTKPIILHGKNLITRLLIKNYHEKFYHANHQSVLNEIKQKFYILSLRNTLKNIINKCEICKIQRAQPCNPKMAALPSGRLAYRSRPFSHCGLDYFGPMMVTVGRRREKRWGVIFTCMCIRAIHLELAHSLSTDSAICALRRFTARRGTPLKIYCDNGTNFRGMSTELSQAIREIDQNQVETFAAKNKIEWIFNPPSAPHMGGAWERLIRSVKASLSIVLKEQAPKEEALITVLAEVEHAVNSRPLTHVSLSPNDQEALTPNHFLLGTSSGQIRISTYDALTLCTRKQWKIAQNFADAFWRRWMREYLPTLIPRKKWQNDENPLKVNDVVLVVDYNTERNQWKKGVVTRIHPGTDGQVRVVEIKTANGNLLRPSRKLIKFLE